MQWKAIVLALIAGLSENDVIFSNDTGLPIARIEIGSKRFEGDPSTSTSGKILISVTPAKHNLRVVFRGGADVDWPHFDFRGVHEVSFERHQNRIEARVQ